MEVSAWELISHIITRELQSKPKNVILSSITVHFILENSVIFCINLASCGLSNTFIGIISLTCLPRKPQIVGASLKIGMVF